MMKKTANATPISFQDMLIAVENDRHARRLAEIKRASSKLRMFEPTAAALAERGIRVANDMARVDCDGMLMISNGGLTEWDNPLHAALIELGFTEIKRRGSTYVNCYLKKGRLTVGVMIKVALDEAADANTQKSTGVA